MKASRFPVTRLALILSLALLLLAVLPVAAQAPVEIVFWDNLFTQGEDTLPHDQLFIFRAIAQFEQENPGITVTRVHQAPDISTFDNTLRAASIAGNGPDLATEFAGGSLLSFSDFLEPLDSYFSKDEMAPIIGWDAVRKDFKTDGALLGIPYGSGSYFGVYYNQALFEQAGIDMKTFTAPATWEDLLTLAQKVKDGGVTPFVVGEQEGYAGAWIMATLVGGLKGQNVFFDMRSRSVPINDPAFVTAYDAYHQLFAKGLTNPNAGSLQNGEGIQQFIQGRGAMLFQGGWSNGEIHDGLGDKAGVFAIPTLAASVYPGAIAGGPNVAIGLMNYSKHKDEAVKFLKFLLRPEIIDMYVELGQVEASNHLKADTSVIQNPLLKAQAAMLAGGKTVYPFDNIMPQEINDLFYRLNASVFTGRMSPQDAANQLEQKYEAMK